LFLKEIDYFIQQGCIQLIESDSKDIYNVTKHSISMLYFLTLYSSSFFIK